MSDPFIGEIRMFGGNFAPVGWALCDGQAISISENEALFYLIGTMYGGDGQSTFHLPDLRGRIPIHMGVSPEGITHGIASQGGSEAEYLTVQQIPVHTHSLHGTDAPANRRSPKNALFAAAKDSLYAPPGASSPMDQRTISRTGGTQMHNNVQPFLCVNFIIALFGIFPPQN